MGKLIDVQIVGVTPLLQHRFSDKAQVTGDQPSRTVVLDIPTPREQCEEVVYRTEDGIYYLPSTTVHGAMTNAGKNHKLKGSRSSVRYTVPAAVFMTSDILIICNGDGKTPAKDYEIDSRSVVNPSTKGRYMRHRPRFEKWSMNFTLRLTGLLPEDFCHKLLNEAGEQQGIGDFRPNCRGPFGTFRVTRWENSKE